jgi:FHA domain
LSTNHGRISDHVRKEVQMSGGSVATSWPESPGTRLDSWKEIASYLNRHVTTVRRWEQREGLPVHRHLHGTLSSIYAYTKELDAWFHHRQPGPDHGSEQPTAAFDGRIPGAMDVPAQACWIVWNGREIAMHEGSNLIGRDPLATVRLDLPSVSRRHARIAVSTDAAVVEDLGSKNGTFLRGVRIASAVRLADLDELQVGSVHLLVRISSGDVATQTVAER